nr:RecName: Full=GAMMA-ctenitoxin-Pb1a; Short=GAMMA-CNTX-Pb1a; AltName: Full=Ctenitoxin-Pb53 [Phoneutria boliviensis]
ESNFKIGMAIR